MKSEFLQFREPKLTDAPKVRSCTVHALQSDLSFTNIYLLKKKYGTELLFHMEHLIRRFTGDGRLQGYSFPVGGNSADTPACIQAIEADAAARGVPLKYCLLTEQQAQLLAELYAGKIEIKCDTGDADYLYKRSDLAELPGTAFHKKRTHVSKFLRNNPSAEFRMLNADNTADVLHVAKLWLEGQEESPALLHEYRAIEHALSCRNELEMTGGIVYVEQQAVAMALVSLINDQVADIHYEKCIPEFRDAYAYINRELAAALSTEYINHEEDLNIPGLRTAKLSYHPSHILRKFTATIYVD